MRPSLPGTEIAGSAAHVSSGRAAPAASAAADAVFRKLRRDSTVFSPPIMKDYLIDRLYGKRFVAITECLKERVAIRSSVGALVRFRPPSFVKTGPDLPGAQRRERVLNVYYNDRYYINQVFLWQNFWAFRAANHSPPGR